MCKVGISNSVAWFKKEEGIKALTEMSPPSLCLPIEWGGPHFWSLGFSGRKFGHLLSSHYSSHPSSWLVCSWCSGCSCSVRGSSALVLAICVYVWLCSCVACSWAHVYVSSCSWSRSIIRGVVVCCARCQSVYSSLLIWLCGVCCELRPSICRNGNNTCDAKLLSWCR